MSSSNKKKLRKEQYMTERQQTAEKEAKKLKYYTLSFWVVIALVVCIFVTAVSINPIKNVIYKNTNVVTIGDYSLSAVELNYFYVDAARNYYNNNSSYIQYLMDVNAPLNEISAGGDLMMSDYMLDTAIDTMKSTYALYIAALAAGHELSQDEKSTVDYAIQLEELYAAYYYNGDTDAYLRAKYGNGASVESYRKYCEVTIMASSYYYSYSDELRESYTAEDLLDYSAKAPYEYNSYTYTYAYLQPSTFYTAMAEDTTTAYADLTDEQKQPYIDAAKAAAEALAAGTYEAVKDFEDAIAALAINNPPATTAVDATVVEPVIEMKEIKNLIYSSNTALFQNWLAGVVKGDTENDEDTFETRTEGEVKLFEYTTTSSDKTSINGYYVVRYGSVNENKYLAKNVHHLLVKFEKETDEAKAAAKEEAEKLLKDWQDGAATLESFKELANKNSDDSGSNTNGGLYEYVYHGQMVEPFENWCYDEARKAGDCEIIETEYGYHIMYYPEEQPTETYRDYLITNNIHAEDLTEWHEGLIEKLVLSEINSKYVLVDKSMATLVSLY